MNPRLFIFKQHELENFNPSNRIHFVIVNLDKAKKYPANFVCVLPTRKDSIAKPTTEFSKVFGKDSLRLAKQLLKNALKDEDDEEIKAQIEKRLNHLDQRKQQTKANGTLKSNLYSQLSQIPSPKKIDDSRT